MMAKMTEEERERRRREAHLRQRELARLLCGDVGKHQRP